MVEYPGIQATLYIFISTLNSAYILNYEPFVDKNQNKLELVNELFITTCGYLLLVFTDFVEDINIKDISGFVMIALIMFNFLLNMMIILYSTLKNIIEIIKNR